MARSAVPASSHITSLIRSLGLEHEHVKADDVLMSLMLIAGCSNWNKPPLVDNYAHENDWNYEADWPIWKRGDEGYEQKRDEPFTTPPVRVSIGRT